MTAFTQDGQALFDKAHLNQGVFTEQRTGECRRRAQETRICHFFDRLPNGQNQSGVDERHNDVRIKLI